MDAFNARLGHGQGRTSRGQGDAVFVLGALEPGWRADLSVGDRAQLVQETDLTDVDLIRVAGTLEVRDVPAGLAWEIVILIDGARRAALRGRPGATRSLSDLAANVSPLIGKHIVAVRLELVKEL